MTNEIGAGSQARTALMTADIISGRSTMIKIPPSLAVTASLFWEIARIWYD